MEKECIMKDLAQELMNLKNEAKQAENKYKECNGRLLQLYKDLQDKFNCDNEKDGDVLINNLNSDYQELLNEIKTETKKVKEKYGFQ